MQFFQKALYIKGNWGYKFFMELEDEVDFDEIETFDPKAEVKRLCRHMDSHKKQLLRITLIDAGLAIACENRFGLSNDQKEEVLKNVFKNWIGDGSQNIKTFPATIMRYVFKTIKGIDGGWPFDDDLYKILELTKVKEEYWFETILWVLDDVKNS